MTGSISRMRLAEAKITSWPLFVRFSNAVKIPSETGFPLKQIVPSKSNTNFIDETPIYCLSFINAGVDFPHTYRVSLPSFDLSILRHQMLPNLDKLLEDQKEYQ